MCNPHQLRRENFKRSPDPAAVHGAPQGCYFLHCCPEGAGTFVVVVVDVVVINLIIVFAIANCKSQLLSKRRFSFFLFGEREKKNYCLNDL